MKKQYGEINKSGLFLWTKKVFSLFLIFVFSASTLAEAKAAKVYTVKLPQKKCNVKERWKGEGDRTVIYIQDAHANLDAQKNISAILQYLAKKEEIMLVNTEGASEEIDGGRVRSNREYQAKKIATDWRMEDGEISGIEHGFLNSRQEFRLKGAEDKELFRKNFRSFYGTQLKRDDILDQINAIEEILNDLKEPVYNEALVLFDQSVQRWKGGELDFSEYLFELHQHIIDLEIEIYDSIHYAAMYEALKLQAQVPEMTLKLEYETLENTILDQIAMIEDEETKEKQQRRFDRHKNQYQNGSMPEKDYLSSLQQIASSLNIDFETFHTLKMQLKASQAFGRLDMNEVIKEVETLTFQVLLGLAKTEDEKMLVIRNHHVELLNKLSRLEALAYEVDYFRENKTLFTFEFFYNFVQAKSKDHGLSHQIQYPDAGFNKILKYAAHFYTGADLRNKVLVDNTLKNMKKDGQRVSVLVAGGYHSDGITEELRKQNISYLVLTPKITDAAKNLNYMDKMMGVGQAMSSYAMSKIVVHHLGDASPRSEEILRSIEDDIWTLVEVTSLGGFQRDDGLAKQAVRALAEMMATAAEKRRPRVMPSQVDRRREMIKRVLNLSGNFEAFNRAFGKLIQNYTSEEPLYLLVDTESDTRIERKLHIFESLGDITQNRVQVFNRLSDLADASLEQRDIVVISANQNAVQAMEKRNPKQMVSFVLDSDSEILATEIEIEELFYSISLEIMAMVNTAEEDRSLSSLLELAEDYEGRFVQFRLTKAARDKIKEAAAQEAKESQYRGAA